MTAGRTAALVAALIASLCVGLWLGGHPNDLPEPLRDAFVDESVALPGDATEVIEENYFRKVDPDKLSDASVDGMVRYLRQRYRDRFSHYFDPEDLEQFEESISGQFSGVGLSVSEVPRGLRVGRVFPDSPAQGAGIAVGDLVLSVEGESIAGQHSEVSTAKIKGPPGTEVTIGVLRPSSGKRREVTLTRAEIAVPITATRMRTVDGTRLGYVALATFTRGAHAVLRQAVERVDKKGAEGIVLDLRGNGGGLLQEAILTASLFLEEGAVVVRTDSRIEGERVFRAQGEELPARPIVVLINRDTASAAEILTAALLGDAGATVVGTRSFGKGVFQHVIKLPSGGALDLTIGEYFTADGQSLAPRGVRPDVPALDNPETAPDEGLLEAFRVLADKVQGNPPFGEQ